MDEAQKRALFLHVTGMDAQEFTSHALAAEPESATFQATGKVLNDYFVLKANVSFERHLFRQIVQNRKTIDQSVLGFVNKQSIVSSVKTRMIISVIKLLTSYSNKFCQKFLEKEGALMLNDLLRIARS